jgi:membrane-associated protein
MRLATSPPGLDETPPSRPWVLLAVAVVAAGALALTVGGVVRLPDLDGALTDLSDTLGAWTYALVAALAFLETGAFVGLIAPGETALALGGVVAAQGKVELGAMLVIAWLAAASGDLVSFLLGRRFGTHLLDRHGPRLGVTAARRERVEGFVDRHGPRAIVIGRFIGIVRAVAPFSFGASRMRLRAFVPWSLLGTAAWASAFTLVGYAFSDSFSSASATLAHAALGAAALVAAVLAWRVHRAQRAARVAA